MGEPAGTRPVLLPEGGEQTVPIYRFIDLAPGNRVSGPAVVEYPGSTLFVPPEWRIEFDEMMNAHGHREAGSPGIDAGEEGKS